MRAWSITDTGKVRQVNQDRYICDLSRGLYVVCDGMGGHNGGEVAAQIAVDILDAAFVTLNSDHNLMPQLAESLASANEAIWKKAQTDPELSEMGTTATVALVVDNHLFAASIGDSPLFLIRDGSLRKLTNDHTLASKMVAEGIISASDPACVRFSHILTRALGVEPLVNVDLLEMNLLTGDILLLATDGLTKMVSEEEILRLLNSKAARLDRALSRLCNLALERGGVDNITMVAVQLDGE